jgi:hypothetical protein
LASDQLTPDVASTLLAQHINAAASFGKGFSLRREKESSSRRARRNSTGSTGSSSDSEADTRDPNAMENAYAATFDGVLCTILEVRRVAAGSEEVRSAVTSSLHVLINTLGALLYPRLPDIVDACSVNASARDLLDFAKLLAQVNDERLHVLLFFFFVCVF